MTGRDATVRKAGWLLVAIAAGALWTACETPLDRAWTLSQRAHVAQSIADPEANANDFETRRPDGASTEAAMDRFRVGESQPDEGPPPPVINLDLDG